MAAIEENLPRPSNPLPQQDASGMVLPPLSQLAVSPTTQPLDSTSGKIPDSIDSVDSALLAALRDPRERLGLLKLEKVMVDFYSNPSDPYLDIGGPYNSVVVSPSTGSNSPNVPPQRPQTTFQRCILHRLADRFRMTRETNNPYIRLWKHPDSCLPPRLLVDLDPSEYAPAQEDQQAPMTTVSSTAVMPPKKMKMKIMKRSGSSGVSNSSDGGSRTLRKNRNSSSQNLSDKERAYAEARARIFSDGDDTAGGASGDNNNNNNNNSTINDKHHQQTAANMSSSAASADNTSQVPSASSSLTGSLPKAASNSSLPSSEEDAPNSNSAPSNNAENSNSNTRPSKATWRNRRQEENDPDFQRGVVLQAVPAYNDHYYAHHQQHHYPATATGAAAPVSWGSVQPVTAAHHLHQQQQQDAYYSGSTNYYQGRGGRGRGSGGRYHSNPYFVGNSKNYGYRRSNSGEAASTTANVHSMEEFPSLR